MGQILSFFGR